MIDHTHDVETSEVTMSFETFTLLEKRADEDARRIAQQEAQITQQGLTIKRLLEEARFYGGITTLI